MCQLIKQAARAPISGYEQCQYIYNTVTCQYIYIIIQHASIIKYIRIMAALQQYCESKVDEIIRSSPLPVTFIECRNTVVHKNNMRAERIFLYFKTIL